MRTILFSVFFVFCFFSVGALPVFEKQIAAAPVIVSGTVLDVRSYWNTSHTMIWTSCMIKTGSVFRGTNVPDTVRFEFAGGQVDDYMIVSSAAPRLLAGKDYLFFLTRTGTKFQLLPAVTAAVPVSANVASGISAITGEQALLQELYRLTGGPESRRVSPGTMRQSATVPVVTSFSPLVVTAGTGTVLTIHGSDFGTTQGSGVVRFTNADAGGLVINAEPYPSDYLLWTDTLIQVRVPSIGPGFHTAGTGPVEVENASGGSVVSQSVLQVDYALTNVFYNGAAVRPDLADLNSAGGYTVTLGDTLVLNTDARQSFFRALERWRCNTQVNMVPNYASSSPLPAGADGFNVVRFDSMNTFVLGTTYLYYSLCSGNWSLQEFDIVFNNQLNWNFSSVQPTVQQYDFESCCMQLIGFSMLIEHVVDTTDVMHGDGSAGLMRRQLNASNLAAGAAVMGLSTQPNSCGPPPHQPAGSCLVGLQDDAGIEEVNWPLNGFCQATFPVKVSLVNYGTAPLTAVLINWELNGILQTPFPWTGSLPHDDTTIVTVASHAFTSGPQAINAWTSSPNGNTNGFTDNDTAVYSFTIGTCTSADARVVSVSDPDNGDCPGILPVKVNIRNQGPTALNYAIIEWTVNGVLQPPYVWTGTLAPSTSVSGITIGTYNFTLPSTPIKAWTTFPNGIADNVPSNDTAAFTYTPVGMDGIYTVGGVSPDYATFTAAINDLAARGICGPVTFNLRPGTYTGTYTIAAATSLQRPILIQAENGDSSTVLLSGSGTILTISGSDYVTIRNLTIQTTGTNNVSGIAGTIDTRFLKVERCRINMPVISSASQNVNGLHISGTNAVADSLDVDRCSFAGGSSGVRIVLGTTIPQANGGQVRNCKFTGQYEYGAIVYNHPVIAVRNNQFTYTANPVIGIYLNNCDGPFEITGNRIETASSTSLSLNFCVPDSTQKALVANNFFRTSGTVTTYSSLELFQSYSVRFYHNTIYSPSFTVIYITNTMSGNAPIRAHLDFVNNIVANPRTGSSALFEITVAPLVEPVMFDLLSHNAYFQGGGLFSVHNVGGNTYSLAEWQGMVHGDSAACTFTPAFQNLPDLHLLPAPSDVVLSGSGRPLAAVLTDIDGQTRDALYPDRGADEFGLHARDASVCAADPRVRACTGSNPVRIRLRNFGQQPLTSATIGWKVNNITQTAYSWTGNITPNDSSAYFAIGNYTFATGTYTFAIWSQQPNGGPDAVAGNDTLYFTLQGGGMSGLYTIGGVSPNYATFTAAKNALVSGGVCGPVVFDVRPGTYTETVVFPAVSGVSPVNTITFRAENGDSSSVILTYSLAANTIQFTGRGFYHFYKLSIKNTVGNAVYFNGCSNIHISHSNTDGLASATATLDEFIEIDHSDITRVFMQSYSYNAGLFWVYPKERNNSVHHIHSQSGYLFFDMQQHLKVYANRFDNSFNNTVISIQKAYDSLYVADNNIASSSVGNTTGMNIVISQILPWSIPVIANNMISLQGSAAAYGLHVTYEESVDILHNTIRINSQQTGVYALYTTGNQTGETRLLNNILVNLTGDPTMILGGGTSMVSDYNVFYGTGPELIVSAWGLANNLSDWQLMSNGQDMHSLELYPQFVSANDLHLNNDMLLADAGVFVPAVPVDIDGNVRNTATPSIGADEIPALPVNTVDAGLPQILVSYPVCSGSVPVPVKIRNCGTNNLASLVLNWSVNGILQPAFSWSGNLAPLAYSSPVVIGSINTIVTDTYNIRIWSSLPNNTADLNPANDTIDLNGVRPRMGGIYTVGGINPDFANIGAALDALEQAGVCAPVIFNIRNGTYSGWSSPATQIAGVSAINTVTFQSESGDSSLVFLSSVNLQNYEYIDFRKVKFGSSSMSIGSGVHHIRFLNCHFGLSISANNGPNDYIVMENCLFTGDVNFSGQTSYIETGGVVRNCRFITCGSLSAALQRNFIAEDNYFECLPPATGFGEALYLNGCRDSVHAERNFIYGNYQIGARLAGSSTNNTIVRFANNMISGTAYMDEGISCTTNFSNVAVYNNNVLLTAPGSYCFFSQSSDALVRNNNFIHQGGGTAYWASGNQAIDISDNNNLYSTGSTLARWNSTQVPDLAGWQAASGMDTNSLSVDPIYISATDLHVLNQALDGMGYPLAEVVTDYDLEIRPVPPDIGADERNFYPNDAGLASLVQPVPACTGVNTITVELKNFGMLPLTSAVIHWSINGVPQPVYNWTGSVATGSTVPVTLGTYFLQHVTPVQFIAWTAMPNSSADGFSFNDTLGMLTISPRMTGLFTIGGVSPDYPDFTTAVADLHTFGVCGPVVFDVRSGIYNEQFQIGLVNGVSLVNTITFQSETGDSTQVELVYNSGSNNNYIVKLDYAQHITFRRMTFRALNTAYGALIEATNDLREIRFNNNRFIGSAYSPAVPYDHVLVNFRLSLLPKHCRIDHNHFSKGGIGLTTQGPDINYADTSIFIDANFFEDQSLRAIEYELQARTQITRNRITTAYPHNNYTAINCYLTCNYTHIAENRIYGFAGTGIAVLNTARAKILNNFVSIRQNAANPYIYSALSLLAVSYSSIINNSLVSSGDRFRGSALLLMANNNVCTFDTLLNNSISTFGEGGHAMRFNNQSLVFPNYFNHNNYYSCADTLISVTANQSAEFTSLQQWQTQTGDDLNSVSGPPEHNSDTDLHIGSNSWLDGKGIPDPNVAFDIDGQPRNTTAPDIGADEFTSVTNDITVVSLEAFNIPCNGNNVTVSLGNPGTTPVNSATVNWSVNGVLQPPYSWTGSLLPSAVSGVFAIGSYTFLPGDNLKAWSSQPNGSSDNSPANDSACCFRMTRVTIPFLGNDTTFCSGDTLTLNGGSFNSYLWSDGSTGPALPVAASGMYWVEVTNPIGCVLRDTINITVLPSPPVPVITQNGSSLLSSAVTGNQWLLNGNPIPGATGQLYVATAPGVYTVVVTGQNGCSSSSVSVTVVGIGETGGTAGDFVLYPNPAGSWFVMETSADLKNNPVQIILFDATGKQVFAREFAPGTTTGKFEITTTLASGIYLVQLTAGELRIQRKLIIEK